MLSFDGCCARWCWDWGGKCESLEGLGGVSSQGNCLKWPHSHPSPQYSPGRLSISAPQPHDALKQQGLWDVWYCEAQVAAVEKRRVGAGAAVGDCRGRKWRLSWWGVADVRHYYPCCGSSGQRGALSDCCCFEDGGGPFGWVQ